MRIGQGVDAHRLVRGRRLVLGGVEIPFDRGLEGHSDGDVLLHAVASALLGAIGKRDLGSHFPSSDPALEGIASTQILSRVAEMVTRAGFAVGNIDATIVAQAPRLAAHLEAMEGVIAGVLNTTSEAINLKVTSTDQQGFVGREEGIAAVAVALLVKAREGS